MTIYLETCLRLLRYIQIPNRILYEILTKLERDVSSIWNIGTRSKSIFANMTNFLPFLVPLHVSFFVPSKIPINKMSALNEEARSRHHPLLV